MIGLYYFVNLIGQEGQIRLEVNKNYYNTHKTGENQFRDYDMEKVHHMDTGNKTKISITNIFS